MWEMEERWLLKPANCAKTCIGPHSQTQMFINATFKNYNTKFVFPSHK